MTTLIADSGSTKTTWCLVDAAKGQPAVIQPVQTQGLNPLYASADEIAAAARTVVEATGERTPDLVQFYGAGCSGDRVDKVETALRRVFTPFTRIEVASDLLGACRALYGHVQSRNHYGNDGRSRNNGSSFADGNRNQPESGKGIACILGTGAIAARYDYQTDEMQTASSLGYILGDEGSGAWLGRNVLSDYLKEQMPSRVRALFEQDFGAISAESAIQHVYQNPFPNRYLASFATFVGSHSDVSYCQQLAFCGIELFFRRNVMRLKPSSGEPISFVGSVAYHLRDTIAQVCAINDLTLGTILKEPMQGLVERR